MFISGVLIYGRVLPRYLTCTLLQSHLWNQCLDSRNRIIKCHWTQSSDLLWLEAAHSHFKCQFIQVFILNPQIYAIRWALLRTNTPDSMWLLCYFSHYANKLAGVIPENCMLFRIMRLLSLSELQKYLARSGKLLLNATSR